MESHNEPIVVENPLPGDGNPPPARFSGGF
jgi:hypothetical protein